MNSGLFYPPWLRFWHWINAGCFLILMFTGASMHFSGPGAAQLDFRTARVLHNAAAVVMVFGYLVYVAGSLLGQNRRYYLFEKGDVPAGAIRQTRYYLLDIFRGKPHPFPHTPGRKFNPLQKLAYLFVMFVLMPVIIVSGAVLFVPDLLPERGVTVYAFAHSIAGYLLSLFLPIHMYLGTTGQTTTSLYRAMMGGSVADHQE